MQISIIVYKKYHVNLLFFVIKNYSQSQQR